MVLLRNEPVDGVPVLPLRADVGSIAVLGRLAVEPNMGDLGSSAVRPPSAVTPVDGVLAAFPDASVTVVVDDDPTAGAHAAADAEVAIVVAGYTAAEEGEFIDTAMMGAPEIVGLFPPPPDGTDLAALFSAGAHESTDRGMTAVGGDRASLRLRPVDEEIIAAVVAANPRTVVVLVAAGAVIAEAWRTAVPATLLMGYAGMEGGHALADVLTGRRNPSGRLPYSVPRSEEHLPFFDREATAITYDRWHGQRLLDRLGVDAAYPHGFGLSYTEFEISGVTVVATSPESVRLRVTVANAGAHDGHHVVQVYGRRSTGAYAGELLLAGFAVVEVPVGQQREVEVDVSLVALAEWDASTRRRVCPDLAAVTLEVGAHAHDPAAICVRAVRV
jgi:beta-glucosidase